MNSNGRPVPASYPMRGYGIDAPRLISPYRAPGYNAYYAPQPPHTVTASSTGSPYRMDPIYHNIDRRDIAQPTSKNPSMEYDEIAGTSEDERSTSNTHAAKHTSKVGRGKSGTAAVTERGKKRAAPTSASNESQSKQARSNADTSAATPEDVQTDSQKRKKKAVSCEGCRRRKLKCDRGWPCGACRDRDEAHLCSWEGGTRPQGQGRDQDSKPLMARVENMEALLMQIAQRIGLDSNKVSPQASSTDGNAIITAVGAPPRAESNKTNDTLGTSKVLNSINTSLLSLGWKSTTEKESMSELCTIMEILPDTQTLRRMCQYFFDEVGWMQYVVDENDFWQQLRGHEELRMMSSGSLMHSRLVNKDNVRHHLQFLAMVLAMCALADLFSDEPEFADVSKNMGIAYPVYGCFFNASQRALNASNPFEEPTLLSLRVHMLIIWGLASIRGPGICVALLSQAVSQLYALELDSEPPASMPKAQARDRIRLFHSVVTMDWLGAGTMKKGYMIREEPIKHPYLFGRQNVKEGLSEKDGFMLPDMWLKLELARINRRACDRTAMSEAEAYSTTLTLQQDLDEVFSDLPQDFESELFAEKSDVDYTTLHKLGVLMMVANQLINLHKRYYIQGWLDPVYRTSRDICFSSARRICLIFRKMFSAIVPLDKIMAMDLSEITKVMDGHQMFSARIWFFAHSSVGACLLLQHHYALMEVHPDAAGPNAEKVREEIIDDLRYTRRILLAMSTRSQVAKSGIAVLARPELTCSSNQGSAGFAHTYPGHQHGHQHAASRDAEDEQARQAELAKDLQSITDHDAFATKRSKRHQETFRRRTRPSGSSTDMANTNATPQSTTFGTPSSTSQSIHNYANGNANKDGMRSSDSTSGGGGFSNLIGNHTPFNIPNSSNKSSNAGQSGAWHNHPNGMPLSEMEALLESALSTDLTTGMPLPPEASFERQADRIGGSQSFILPTAGVMGNGPMSPFTSAFLGAWENQTTTGNNHTNVDGNGNGDSGRNAPAADERNGSTNNVSNWF